jgi:hypothetical protein
MFFLYPKLTNCVRYGFLVIIKVLIIHQPRIIEGGRFQSIKITFIIQIGKSIDHDFTLRCTDEENILLPKKKHHNEAKVNLQNSHKMTNK